jgi:polyisoprenoid-binding protein YceI
MPSRLWEGILGREIRGKELAVRHLISCGVAVVVGFLSLPASAAPQTYQLEPTHVDVLFAVNHLGFSWKHGSFRALAGTLEFDADHPEASKVHVTIKVDSIDTALVARDNDLKSEGFFDTAKFPQIEFTSTAITKTGTDMFRVVGNLTMHGVTQPIELQATLNGTGANPFDHKPTIGFSVTGTLKRSEFGITQLAAAIGDLVRITADAEFNQPAPK